MPNEVLVVPGDEELVRDVAPEAEEAVVPFAREAHSIARVVYIVR